MNFGKRWRYGTDWKIGSSFGFRKTGGDRLINGILLEFETERLIQHSLYGPDSEAAMAILTYEFLEKDGVTVLTGKEELMHPLDEDAFERRVGRLGIRTEKS